MFPSSPKLHNNSGNHHSPHSNDFGPLPISPHVNVPNAHVSHVGPAPPLPPRVRRKNPQEFSHSQIRQAPDAPQLPARDQSPPALPPRTHLNSTLSNTNTNDNWNHQFNLSLHTSTIMMRRNSALEQQRKDSPLTPATPSSAASGCFELKLSHNSPVSLPPRKRFA